MIPEFTGFPKMSRMSRPCVISEKIDGSNSLICITEDNQFLVGSRTRWITPDDDNHGFARWAFDHEEELRRLGQGKHFGEWWGCLSAETSITLANGKIDKIGRIVNQKKDISVLSFNFNTGKIEPKKIVGWKKGTVTKNWLTIEVKRKRRGGKRVGLHLTPNHTVFIKTDKGYTTCQAGLLKIGDKLFMNLENIGYVQQQLIRGSMLGDASISYYSFVCGHSNQEYSLSKIHILKNLICNTYNRVSGKGSNIKCFSTRSLPAMREIETEIYENGVKKITVDYVKKLNPCGLAFWYMDDGSLQESKVRGAVCSIYTNGFCTNDVIKVSEYFNEIGYENYVVYHDNRPILKFTPTGTVAFHASIYPYILPEMSYKIIKKFRGYITAWHKTSVIVDEHTTLVESEIVSINKSYANKNRNKTRYDIEVEGNNNFFANNLLVHNSGIQRSYNLKEKRYSMFNTIRWCLHDQEPQRIETQDPRIEKYQEKLPSCCGLVPVLYKGMFTTQAVEDCVEFLRKNGSQAAPGFMQPEGVVVYHIAGNVGFKKTLEKDEEPKSKWKGLKNEA